MKSIKMVIIEGIPKDTILKELLHLYQTIFDDAKPDFFIDRITTKTDIIIVLTYFENSPVGFKIGYRYNETTFYSWVGGVLPDFRRKGIAQELAKKQEELVKKKGYKKLRTKSMNRFKPMLILNIKNGFDIVQVYTNTSGQQKIVFEKEL
ncbi:GNAT family N-acetyltransferase [Tenacibaculum jejuense]|uniref:GCN5-related N-acetyltransferase n=1 Tax=Tenacibaculum jejuense TaxID=584609 RepID=A0A238UFC9_9FLAO|nr:GNAT family N-acetyltransferase [Tenacibaculum jejuense]SNR17755.1 GCN5-related N-acetyltransferase [Tenacibaculum jejuense]